MTGTGPIPPRWLRCPRKSGELIAGKFLALKTPLDGKFDSQVEPQFRFAPSMLLASMKSYKVRLGLWVDLTNTGRFYDRREVEQHEEGCKYVKLRCRGHGGAPSPDQTQEFVHLCQQFVREHPTEVIAVHCTHGFNRTGFLIAAFLIQVHDWSPEAALAAFAQARPPGIYKDDYIQELFERYGDPSDAPAAPERPEWCFEDDQEQAEDDDEGVGQSAASNGGRHSGGGDEGNGGGEGHDAGVSGGGGRRRRELNKKNPQFMDGVPGVRPVTEQPLLQQVQRRVQDMCEWNK